MLCATHTQKSHLLQLKSLLLEAGFVGSPGKWCAHNTAPLPSANPLEFLRQLPQFQLLRTVLQQNLSMLQGLSDDSVANKKMELGDVVR